ncbi:proprotein convertase subtilisin/kexin type 4 isoform X8 [Vulpes lagopus]|uniref:proprotein convertase subtilisin/kexin type 4 isoform X8 n=1 Tax=Vulpes lagopus TaxID=494514 RepID=UPI001BC9D844|nr:proprotein convertase subtilisin/kexin type 4 isoform X8 [Vulpes lagopus]
MRPARTALWLRLAVALGLALVGPLPVGWSSARAPIYVSSWAVRVSQGYREAERLARKFGFVYLGQIFPDGQYFHLRHRGVVQQSLTPHWGHCLRLKKDPKVQWFEQQTLRRRVKRSLVVPTDPWFPKQWYMNNKVQPDLNILQVWSQGLSGQGVVVSVLDDGIEKDHPDLWANYDPLASYDFNDYDPDPQPRYTPSDENRHGTRCAGEVAAMANNGFCGTGVAYNARIGGVRMLDGTITDVIEAQSLSLQPQHIHIYSASWGPEDDGRTVDGPGILTREAFRRGVTKGRGGLGTLFVWASGNGGLHYDNCNCDGYTNSIHTLSVGSTTEHGRVPWYSEACASTLTTTYSSGVATDPQIVTTDLHHQCTDKHTGTSASAPLAAGMIALALEANPFLTWRDMQHLVVRASRPAQLQAEDWRTNGVGRQGEARPGGGGATAMGRVMTTPPHSEPPLWLWAAGRQAAGGHGSNVAAHTTPAEMRRSDRPHPHPHPAADASEEERVGLRGPRQLHPLPGARAGAAVSVLQPPGGPGDLAHQPHGHPLHARGHQTLGHQRPRLQQLDLHVHPLLGRGPAGPVDPGPGKQRLLFQHGDAVPLHAAALRDGRGHDGAAPGPPECHSSAYTLGHLCLSYCPPRYCKHTQQAVTGGPGRPATPALRVCSSCRASCCPCRGGSPLNCTACPPSYSLREHRGSCSGPVPPNSTPQPTAVGHPRCHRGRAQAVVLTLLAVAFGSPLLCRLLYRLPAATWGPPRRWGHPHHPPRSSCCLEPRDI